jgi:hypothetical protein
VGVRQIELLADGELVFAYRDLGEAIRRGYESGSRHAAEWQRRRLRELREELVGRGLMEEEIRTVGRPGPRVKRHVWRGKERRSC